MKFVQNEHKQPRGAIIICYFNSIIRKTLFLGTLCLGLTAQATWGQVPTIPNLGNGLPRGVYPKLPSIKNVTSPTTIPRDEDQGEDEFFGEKPDDWPMYNYNALGTRYNTVEHKLSPENVQHLKLKWSFITDGNVNATPIVFDHKVYAGDTTGNFYALSQTGQLLWKTKVNGPITASALATNNVLIFGDQQGFIYGLNRITGKIVWKIKPNPHPFAAVYSSPTKVGKYVAIGISSNENDYAERNPSYPCCSSRGSVVLLNPTNGKVVWQTYTITTQEASNGSSGATVWSTPTYDAATGIIYVTTGDNYTTPATKTSDAFIALNVRDGAIVWRRQLRANDIGLLPGGDYDFGDSPQIYTLPDGRKVVGAGQKTGIYYVLDAATGNLINQYEALALCTPSSGGLFADSAVALGVVFANGTSCSNSGELFALQGNAQKEIWHFTSGPNSGASSGVAVANGVVYLQVINPSSTSDTAAGTLYALDAKSGTSLAAIPIGAGISGPSVADGQVYVGTGITIPPLVEIQGGSILAFGL